MSAQGNPNQPPIIPSITGYPMVDTMLRVFLTTACAGITGAIVATLHKYGYNDPNASLMVSGGVLTVLIGAASVAWSFIQTQMTKVSTAQHVVTALSTGEIPNDILKVAVASPKIPDTEIMKATTSAQTIKALND